MYANGNKKLYEDGLEKFSDLWITGHNVFLLAYFVLAFIGMYPLQIYKIPIFSFLFIIYMMVMLLFVLEDTSVPIVIIIISCVM